MKRFSGLKQNTISLPDGRPVSSVFLLYLCAHGRIKSGQALSRNHRDLRRQRRGARPLNQKALERFDRVLAGLVGFYEYLF